MPLSLYFPLSIQLTAVCSRLHSGGLLCCTHHHHHQELVGSRSPHCRSIVACTCESQTCVRVRVHMSLKVECSGNTSAALSAARRPTGSLTAIQVSSSQPDTRLQVRNTCVSGGPLQIHIDPHAGFKPSSVTPRMHSTLYSVGLIMLLS